MKRTDCQQVGYIAISLLQYFLPFLGECKKHKVWEGLHHTHCFCEWHNDHCKMNSQPRQIDTVINVIGLWKHSKVSWLWFSDSVMVTLNSVFGTELHWSPLSINEVLMIMMLVRVISQRHKPNNSTIFLKSYKDYSQIVKVHWDMKNNCNGQCISKIANF